MATLDAALGWCFAVAGVGVMMVVLTWAARCQRSSYLSTSTKREALVALRSGFVLLAMTIPILYTNLWDLFSDNLRGIYIYLPFWYCFIVDTHFGRCLRNSYQALLGVCLATLAMVLMNYLMPGGAGPWAHDPNYMESAWLPGGYSRGFAIFLSVLIAYLFFLIDLQVPTKQYGLAMFASILLDFMNPDQGKDDFVGVLWDYDGVPTYSGPTWSQLYFNVLAVTLAMLTLPSSPSFQNCPRQTSWCFEDAVHGYALLAEDTMLGFERLVMHFRKSSSELALNSSYLFLKQLGARRTKLEQLLEDARWETKSSQLRELRRLSKLLRGLRQVLRVALEDLRNFGHSFKFDKDIEETSVYLDGFLAACRDVMHSLGGHELLRQGADAETLARVASCAREGQDALTRALECLCAVGAGGERVTRLETIFIEGLQTWMSLVDEFLNEPEAASKQSGQLPCLWREMNCPSRKRHVNAIRLCTSWSLALLWSIFKRDYNPTTVSCVSFIFSESLSGMFDRNVNRMLGVAMGHVLGTLPAVILTRTAFCSDQSGIEFDMVPKIATYMVVMFLLWAAAMYGYLAAEAKWSYAYLLWAANGGVQMIKHFPVPGAGASKCAETSNTFVSIFDNFTGCLLLIFVDLIFAVRTTNLTVHRLAQRILDCLQEISSITEGLLDRGSVIMKADALSRRIAAARQTEEESGKEDLVWSHLFTQPYNREIVSATLSECDDFYVAVYALQATAARCGSSISVPDIMTELVPRGLMMRARRYPKIFEALFLKEGDPNTELDDVLDQQTGEDFLPFQYVVGSKLHVGKAMSAASVVALRVRIWQICIVLQRLRVIYEERADWATDEWNCNRRDRSPSDASSAMSERRPSASSSGTGEPREASKEPAQAEAPGPAPMRRADTCQLAITRQDVLEFAAAARLKMASSRDLAEGCASGNPFDPDLEAIDVDLEECPGGAPPQPPGAGRGPPGPAPRWASLLPCCAGAPAP